MNSAAPIPSIPPQALAGLKVLELGQLIAGPFAGKTLADFGAEVIKIEPPATEAAAGGGRPQRGTREPLQVMGAHPVSGAEIKLMEGRFKDAREEVADKCTARITDRQWACRICGDEFHIDAERTLGVRWHDVSPRGR